VNRSPFFMMIMSWRLTFPKHAAAQIRWRQQGKNSPATTRCLNSIDFLLIDGSTAYFAGQFGEGPAAVRNFLLTSRALLSRRVLVTAL
jgi:hypothetical protein